MSRAHGVDANKDDVALCMVIGCTHKAIYLNGNTRRVSKSLGRPFRGYCSEHKSYAFAKAPKSDATRSDWILRHIKD